MLANRPSILGLTALAVISVLLILTILNFDRDPLVETNSPLAQSTSFPTLPPHLADITSAYTATLDPSKPTPYFIHTESQAIQYAKELSETETWVDHVVKRSNMQSYYEYFVIGEAQDMPFGDDLLWVVVFENSEVMALRQAAGHTALHAASDRGEELGEPGGYVAFLAFDDHGNVMGGGFLDKVDAEWNIIREATGWKTKASGIPEFP